VTTLPEEYITQMRQLLADDFPKFMEIYQQPPIRSLRFNTLKIHDKQLKQIPFSLQPVPWCKEGYYFQFPKDRPGKHIYHATGLYYIQEASAMSPVEALAPKPGEIVLDLCAAPGGKTTQISTKMEGKGMLFANEIDPKRCRILIENVERIGIRNAIILNETPKRLANRFPQFFDRILVDAPCSGEGMFRKDPDTRKRWSSRLIRKCAELQYHILASAAVMLRPTGRLVYSTCTFNTFENEAVIQSFLANHPEFELIPVPQRDLFQEGYDPKGLTARLWPHQLKGEGHFIAVLQKKDQQLVKDVQYNTQKPLPNQIKQILQSFWNDTFDTPFPIDQPFLLFGHHVYLVPERLPSLKGLKVKRPGLYLGMVKGKRFIPSYALAMTQRATSVKRTVNFSADSPDLSYFMQGGTLKTDQEKGWVLITVDSYPLSWAKSADQMLKNHLPKWLRWTH